jgi:hypothetical protein
MVRLFLICASVAWIGATAAYASRPPTPTVKRPVATGTRGPQPGKIGGPARHTGTIGGPTPR